MIKSYAVIILRLNLPEDNFRLEMSRLGLTTEVINHIIEKAPIIMKAGIPLDLAEKYARAIEKAGGVVNIKEYGILTTVNRQNDGIEIEPLESFTMCRQCGHKQIRKAACVKCGFSLK